MIGHNQRFAPAHREAKKILTDKALGDVITFRTVFKHAGPEFWSIDRTKNTWFFSKEASLFGVLGDLGIHKVDLIRWLLEEEILEVISFAGTLNKRYEDGTPIEIEDNASCILKTQGGKVGTLEVSWTNYGSEENSTTLYCEDGVIKIYTHPEYDLIIEKKKGGDLL